MNHGRQFDSLFGESSRRVFTARLAQLLLGVGLMPATRIGAQDQPPTPADEPPQNDPENPHRPLRIQPVRQGQADRVIYLFMGGGMSHLDTFDPKPGTDVQGPIEAIRTSVPGMRVGQYLPRLAKQMNHIALIRSMHTTQGAHERGQYFLRTSYLMRGTIQHPSVGAWTLKLAGKLNPTLPGNVRIGGGSQHPSAGFLEAQFAPLPLGDPSNGLPNSRLPEDLTSDRFQRRLHMAEFVDRPFRKHYKEIKQVRARSDAYREALRLMHSKELAAFDLNQEPAWKQEAYGNDTFGQGCLLAQRLVAHGVRFVEVALGGWDTHQDNFEQIEQQSEILDRALSALLADLNSQGLLRRTLVVLATEFGRTPRINANNGRDHHPKAFSTLLAGGGIQGGRIYGRTDLRGMEVEQDGVTIPDLNATIAYALKLKHDTIVSSPSGRPFKIGNRGKPIVELF